MSLFSDETNNVFLFVFQEAQTYMLNFHGRVTQPSIKNFQLTHKNDGKLKTKNKEQEKKESTHS